MEGVEGTCAYLRAPPEAKGEAVESLMDPLMVYEQSEGICRVSGYRADDTWVDADVATELSQWLHFELRVAVNQ